MTHSVTVLFDKKNKLFEAWIAGIEEPIYTSDDLEVLLRNCKRGFDNISTIKLKRLSIKRNVCVFQLSTKNKVAGKKVKLMFQSNHSNKASYSKGNGKIQSMDDFNQVANGKPPIRVKVFRKGEKNRGYSIIVKGSDVEMNLTQGLSVLRLSGYGIHDVFSVFNCAGQKGYSYPQIGAAFYSSKVIRKIKENHPKTRELKKIIPLAKQYLNYYRK